MTETTARLFELVPNGDPFSRNSWTVREYANSFNEETCTYRGDLSPIRGRANAKALLRRLYPNCRIRTER